MTGREITKRAVDFANPPRVPVYLFNKDREKSDIIAVSPETASTFKPRSTLDTEWGFVWEKIDDTMGQPGEPVVKDWDDFNNFSAPDPGDGARFENIPAKLSGVKNQYKIFSNGITGFNLVTFIRGFDNTLCDFYGERKNIEQLIDIVFSYEEQLIGRACGYDFDAIAFYDDWGTQNSLMVSPKMFREIFLPRYRRQFNLARKAGKHVFFHSCGYVYDIIAPMIGAGVDIFNFNQPDVMGIDKLAREFGGKVCFNCPVDLQKVAITADKKTIFDYTKKLVDKFGSYGGGFIGYAEEYGSIGLSERNYQYCVEALEKYGTYAG